MTTTRIYPVLMTRDVTATADFYRDTLGLRTTFESDWYVSLRLSDWELAVLHCDHETVPLARRGVVSQGVLLNIEVDDVDAVHDRLVHAGHEVVQPLRSEDFGQRHVIVAAPDGVPLDIITEIPPSEEFAAAYGRLEDAGAPA